MENLLEEVAALLHPEPLVANLHKPASLTLTDSTLSHVSQMIEIKNYPTFSRVLPILFLKIRVACNTGYKVALFIIKTTERAMPGA